MLRPRGVQLLQAALKALPEPKLAMVAVPVSFATFPVVGVGEPLGAGGLSGFGPARSGARGSLDNQWGQ